MTVLSTAVLLTGVVFATVLLFSGLVAIDPLSIVSTNHD